MTQRKSDPSDLDMRIGLTHPVPTLALTAITLYCMLCIITACLNRGQCCFTLYAMSAARFVLYVCTAMYILCANLCTLPPGVTLCTRGLHALCLRLHGQMLYATISTLVYVWRKKFELHFY